MRADLRNTVCSGATLALAGVGDGLLYSVLPLHYPTLSVPYWAVGLLLSVNRFVRIVSNQLMAWLFSRHGFRNITILAAALASLSTFVYALAAPLVVWIVARIVWGLCYSSLRISAITYSLPAQNTSTHLGLNRALQETGPLFALLAGPILVHYFSVRGAFFLFSLLSAGALFFALCLPETERSSQTFRFVFKPWPSSLNFLVFGSSLLVEGVLVVALARLFSGLKPDSAALLGLVAFYLVFRRLCTLVLSPVAGWLADRFGLRTVFILSLLLTTAGLIMIVTENILSGTFLAFLFQGISSSLSPAYVLPGESRLQAVAATTTWRDLGAGAGALLAGFLVTQQQVYAVLISGVLVLVPAVLVYAQCKTAETTKRIWK